ncbi:hypothetical protein Tco_0821248 [Tanacetum coccineum]|uniref:Retrovirus-related Pol polyprotein from transposon TNT 1-94 n=1 Tax=Tanacetum coccineum TaxID=301880 RepID=A0ABQ5ADG7_9ASTR
MLLIQAQENGVALDEEQLLFIAGGKDNVVDENVDEQPVQDLALNVDNVFQADDCDAFDSDVDEAPTTQTMFMANLSSADPVYDEKAMSCLMISNFYLRCTIMIIIRCWFANIRKKQDACDAWYIPNYVVDSLDDLYEGLAKFELTEREQKINEQLRIVIVDRNRKEENLKMELHSVKLQLLSTINQNKSMVEVVTSLKKNFKQKENKYIEEFLDMKALKEKNKVAIGYKNPLCLTRVKQVQHALYNGYEIIKTNHVSAIVHNSEDTIEISEITKKKMNDKMKDPDMKNLLIANDNLIADCLSKEVFYIAMNSELNLSRFTEIHDAHTTVQERCLELKAELSNLHDTVQKDDHTELVKRFSNLEVNHLNLQLKYQNLKERLGNNPPHPARDTPDFDLVFVIGKMKASL